MAANQLVFYPLPEAFPQPYDRNSSALDAGMWRNIKLLGSYIVDHRSFPIDYLLTRAIVRKWCSGGSSSPSTLPDLDGTWTVSNRAPQRMGRCIISMVAEHEDRPDLIGEIVRDFESGKLVGKDRGLDQIRVSRSDVVVMLVRFLCFGSDMYDLVHRPAPDEAELKVLSLQQDEVYQCLGYIAQAVRTSPYTDEWNVQPVEFGDTIAAIAMWRIRLNNDRSLYDRVKVPSIPSLITNLAAEISADADTDSTTPAAMTQNVPSYDVVKTYLTFLPDTATKLADAVVISKNMQMIEWMIAAADEAAADAPEARWGKTEIAGSGWDMRHWLRSYVVSAYPAMSSSPSVTTSRRRPSFWRKMLCRSQKI